MYALQGFGVLVTVSEYMHPAIPRPFLIIRETSLWHYGIALQA